MAWLSCCGGQGKEHIASRIVPSLQSCENNRRCMRFLSSSVICIVHFPQVSCSRYCEFIIGKAESYLRFLFYLLCGARWTALCLRRPDTGHTQRHNRVCMSRYQYFSLAKGMPNRPHTINTGICVVDQATMFQRVSSYQERGNYARESI